MERGDAVDGVRADDREIGHAEGFRAAFFDERENGFLGVVAGPLGFDDLHETAVDLVDDLGVAREDAGEERHAPLFESLGEQRVVGVAEGRGDDGPGVFPGEIMLVEEDADELGDGDGGVRVVELHGDFGVEVLPGVARDAEVAADDVAQRTGDEKILLHEAQLLAVLGLVVRVKHLRDGLADGLLAHGVHVAAAVEGDQVELLGRTRSPETEEVHRLRAVAGDRNVVGHAEDRLGVHPARAGVAFVIEDVFHAAVDLHVGRVFGADDFPRRAEDHPVVGMLDLVSVDKLLLKQTELVVNAVADGGQIERGEGIEETRRKTAETAVAEPHVHFALANGLPIDAEFLQRTARLVVEAGVVEIVLEQAAHEIFEREIVEPTDILLVVRALGRDEAGEDLFTNGQRRGEPPVARFGGLQIAGQRKGEIAQDGLLEVTAAGDAVDLGRRVFGFRLLRFGR